MSDTLSFADKYAMKIMVLGFILFAIGAGAGMAIAGAMWSKVAAGAGLVVYIIGRVLQATRKKR